jgi:chromosome segregation protein
LPGEFVLFLKSLDITGFKSFSRSTRFELAPGITALVGPNGSGKSNVVDAIRWCLGEQSIRDLRGQRAEDVIYAGTRQVLGAAEVILTFAPSGVESSSLGDLTIARRLYRSGESEYLVDGRKARLRDLLDKLRALGIDGSRHIVVTQGMADALLSAAPTERRTLLEQAAGLSGYRVRRDEARQKLGTTEQNIATIALVLEELEPRLRALRKQARAVLDREEAQAVLRRRLHDWYAHRWKSATSEADERTAQMKSVGEERRVSEARLAELENATEAVLQREHEWQQRVDMLVAANRALERDRDAADRGRAETEQHLLSAHHQREAAEARKVRAREAMQGALQRISEVASSLRTADEEIARLRAKEDALRVKLELESASLRQADRELQHLQSDAAAQERTSRDEIQRGEELLREIQRADRRRSEVENWLGATHAMIQEGERERESLVIKAKEASSQTDDLVARLRAGEDVVSAWRGRATRLDVMLARTRGAATDAQRRRDAAQKSLHPLGVSGCGSLVHSIDIQRGWETAIAGALGAWAHATTEGRTSPSLHEDDNPGFDAWRATLAPAIIPGMWADSVVNGMPRGRVNPLRTSLLVETETEAERIWNVLRSLPAHRVGTPGILIVTRSGACWNAIGRDTSPADDRAVSYLRLKRESETMNSRFDELSARAARLDTARTEATARRTLVEEEIAGSQVQLRDSRAHSVELENRLARLQRQCADNIDRTEALGIELQQLDDLQTSLRSQSSYWEASKREREGVASELEHRVGEATALVESLQVRVSRLDKDRSDARHAYEVAAAYHRSQTQLHDAIAAERDRLQRELAAGEAEKSELEGSSRRLQDEVAVHAQQLKQLNLLLEEHSASLSAARAARPPREASSEQLREARTAVSALVRRHERAQAEVFGAQGRVEALVSEISEDLGVQPLELRESNEEPPSETEIKRLRSRAMQYADAEPSVVEEARELGERHAYLLEHVEDLRAAAETLQRMMGVADAEMRSQFGVAFVAVSEEFSRVFEVMLRGGRARLEQSDGGGIEVVAQLPGKRSRSSAAFSGGERSLIASSLLFGVLKMRPAPFCVLDEVDASLDESNVDRYLAALRDISRKTQAVVVTHNRATMAAADVLYGLTMDADGASTVLSLRLDAQAAG